MHKACIIMQNKGILLNFILPKTSQGYFFEHNRQLRHSEVSVLSTRYSFGNSYADVKAFIHPFWVLDYSHVNCGFCRVGKRKNAWLDRLAGHIHLYAPKTQYWEDTSSAPLPHLSSFMTFIRN